MLICLLSLFFKSRLPLLEQFDVSYEMIERFGEAFLSFEDPHGLLIELVEREEGKQNDWTFNGVTPEVAIKGFGGAVLLTSQPEQTMQLLEQTMGLEKVGTEGDYVRFRSFGEIGNVIDVNKTPVARGRMGVGVVHHIAWRATDDQDQLDWQRHVAQSGYQVTPVQDRNYFNAIYFRELGGILFEIATDPPGFAHDESVETMGEALKLPPQYEAQRSQIEQIVLPIEVREIKGKGDS